MRSSVQRRNPRKSGRGNQGGERKGEGVATGQVSQRGVAGPARWREVMWIAAGGEEDNVGFDILPGGWVVS